ncbi:MAG: diguanylate cyclase [Campylobacterota bacterium]|nr:diguanylate cyclase [Campylobacterota bacterium]
MKNKIILSFSITIILILFLGTISIVKMNQLANLSEKLYKHPYTVTSATKTIKSNLMSMDGFMKDIKISTSNTEIENIVYKLNEAEGIIFKQYEIVFDRYLGDKDDIQKSFDAFVAWKPIRDKLIDEMLEQTKSSTIVVNHNIDTDYINDLDKKVNTLVDYAKNKAIFFNKNAIDNKNSSIVLVLVLLVFVLAVVLTIFILLMKHILKTQEDEKLINLKKEQHKFISLLQDDYIKIDSLKEICDKSINHIIDYFGAINGSLYIYDEDNKKLYLGATYGIKYDSLEQTLDMHENLISENILERKTKIIDVEQKVNVGIIETHCIKLVTIPVMEFDKSIGTIQLVFDKNFNKIDIEFLETVVSLMGTYIYKAQKDDESLRYLKLIDQNVLISKTDLDGNIIEVSEQLCTLSKYTKEELIGKTHRVLRHPDMSKEIFKELWGTITKGHTWRGELKNRTKDGGFYWISSVVAPDCDVNGNVIGYTAIRDNITDKKLVERIAITDGLTSLYNRRHFDTMFPQQILANKREKKYLVFVLIDIDHFKQYNDTYGHQDGDTTLKLVAQALKNTLQRPYDFTFRLGGEEFGLLYTIEDKNDALEIANNAKKNVENLKIEHTGNSASKFVTISSGMYIINPQDDSLVEEIYKKSDEALYVAKQSGRNQISIVK